MKKVSRLLSVLLVMAMVLLSACSVQNTDSGSNDVGSKDTPADNDTPEKGSTGTPVTLTVEVFDRGTTGQTPPDNNYWTDWIQENFGDPNNIDVKFITCPRSEEVNRLNVWMASGQAPDVSVTYDKNTIYNYYKSGGLADLTEPLNEYGQNLKEYLGEDLLKLGAYKGVQYNIPAKRTVLGKFATYIRKDWLDALNLPVPTTIDEFYDTMKAFKEQNPGNVDNVIPMSMPRDVAWAAAPLLETFKTDKSEKMRFMTKEPFMWLASPGYKEGMRFLNKMYNEGLISPEFPLDTDNKMADSDMIRGAVGCLIGNFDYPLRSVPGLLEGLKQNVPDAELVPIDPFKDSDGVTTKNIYNLDGIRIIVPKTSERVNEAIKYLNWMSQKEVIFFLQFGEEGWGHTMKDGLPILNKVEGEKVFDSSNNIDYTLIVNGVDLGDDEKNVKMNSLQYQGYEEIFIQAYNYSTINGYPDPVIAQPLEAEGKYSNSLREKGYEVYAKCLTSKPDDFDKTWETMYQEYLDIGGQEVLDARAGGWEEENGK